MIHVLASITVKASERDAFLEIFKANVPKVLEEEGCVDYAATGFQSADNQFRHVETDVARQKE